jgi:hypothetical protein
MMCSYNVGGILTNIGFFEGGKKPPPFYGKGGGLLAGVLGVKG